jgi:hypothetical protein
MESTCFPHKYTLPDEFWDSYKPSPDEKYLVLVLPDTMGNCVKTHPLAVEFKSSEGLYFPTYEFSKYKMMSKVKQNFVLYYQNPGGRFKMDDFKSNFDVNQSVDVGKLASNWINGNEGAYKRLPSSKRVTNAHTLEKLN